MKKQNHSWQTVPPGWKINLNRYCGDKHWLKHPVLIGRNIYTTNGTILIRTEKGDPYTSNDHIEYNKEDGTPLLHEFKLKPTHQGYWISHPLLKETLFKSEINDCPECKGYGDIDFHHVWTVDNVLNRGDRVYNVVCEGCEGSGEVQERSVFNNHSFDHSVADLLPSNLPDLEVFTPVEDGILYFKFTGGVGIVSCIKLHIPGKEA